MIDTNITIKLYSFHELTSEAKHKAIEQHRSFLLCIMTPGDFISGEAEYDTPEQLAETYEREYEYYLMEDEPIIDSIQCNDYLFFPDGELAQTTAYCGAHPRAGEVDFKYHGVVYCIQTPIPNF